MRTSPDQVDEAQLSNRGLLAICCTVAIAFAMRLWIGPHAVDDAYITFRYVNNLARNLGFVYNTGERVLGTITPLCALLLTGLRWLLDIDIPWIAVLINAMADTITCVLLFKIALRLSGSRLAAATAALMFALCGQSIKYAVGGMETSLFTLLLMAIWYKYLEGHHKSSAVLCALAILTRPDAILVPVLLVGHMLLVRRPIRAILGWTSVVVLLVVPWFVFATWYFGSSIPNSALAKAIPIYMVGKADSALQFLYQFGLLLVGGVVQFEWGGIALPAHPLLIGVSLAFAIPQVVIAIPAGRESIKRVPRSIVIFGFLLAYVAVYSLTGLRGSLVAEWYLVPLLPLYFLLLSQGALRLVRTKAHDKRILTSMSLVGILILSQVMTLNLSRDADKGFLVPVSIWTERETLYRDVAIPLNDQVSSDTIIAAPEIGALGFFSKARIFDTVGLVSPEALAYYALAPDLYATNNAIPPRLIEATEPEYVIPLEVFMRNSLLPSQFSRENYQLVQQVDTDAFSSQGFLVFKRVE